MTRHLICNSFVRSYGKGQVLQGLEHHARKPPIPSPLFHPRLVFSLKPFCYEKWWNLKWHLCPGLCSSALNMIPKSDGRGSQKEPTQASKQALLWIIQGGRTEKWRKPRRLSESLYKGEWIILEADGWNLLTFKGKNGFKFGLRPKCARVYFSRLPRHERKGTTRPLQVESVPRVFSLQSNPSKSGSWTSTTWRLSINDVKKTLVPPIRKWDLIIAQNSGLGMPKRERDGPKNLVDGDKICSRGNFWTSLDGGAMVHIVCFGGRPNIDSNKATKS